MKAQRFWSERYAGYEPGLHGVDQLFPVIKPKLTLRKLEDDGARPDWRLASSAPMKATRKANGSKA